MRRWQQGWVHLLGAYGTATLDLFVTRVNMSYSFRAPKWETWPISGSSLVPLTLSLGQLCGPSPLASTCLLSTSAQAIDLLAPLHSAFTRIRFVLRDIVLLARSSPGEYGQREPRRSAAESQELAPGAHTPSFPDSDDQKDS